MYQSFSIRRSAASFNTKFKSTTFFGIGIDLRDLIANEEPYVALDERSECDIQVPLRYEHILN